jgi:hypothetical protein
MHEYTRHEKQTPEKLSFPPIVDQKGEYGNVSGPECGVNRIQDRPISAIGFGLKMLVLMVFTAVSL